MDENRAAARNVGGAAVEEFVEKGTFDTIDGDDRLCALGADVGDAGVVLADDVESARAGLADVGFVDLGFGGVGDNRRKDESEGK